MEPELKTWAEIQQMNYQDLRNYAKAHELSIQFAPVGTLRAAIRKSGKFMYDDIEIPLPKVTKKQSRHPPTQRDLNGQWTDLSENGETCINIAEIQGMTIVWPNECTTPLRVSDDGKSVEMIIEGHIFTGTLQKERSDIYLKWDDGDVWMKEKIHFRSEIETLPLQSKGSDVSDLEFHIYDLDLNTSEEESFIQRISNLGSEVSVSTYLDTVTPWAMSQGEASFIPIITSQKEDEFEEVCLYFYQLYQCISFQYLGVLTSQHISVQFLNQIEGEVTLDAVIEYFTLPNGTPDFETISTLVDIITAMNPDMMRPMTNGREMVDDLPDDFDVDLLSEFNLSIYAPGIACVHKYGENRSSGVFESNSSFVSGNDISSEFSSYKSDSDFSDTEKRKMPSSFLDDDVLNLQTTSERTSIESFASEFSTEYRPTTSSATPLLVISEDKPTPLNLLSPSFRGSGLRSFLGTPPNVLHSGGSASSIRLFDGKSPFDPLQGYWKYGVAQDNFVAVVGGVCYTDKGVETLEKSDDGFIILGNWKVSLYDIGEEVRWIHRDEIQIWKKHDPSKVHDPSRSSSSFPKDGFLRMKTSPNNMAVRRKIMVSFSTSPLTNAPLTASPPMNAVQSKFRLKDSNLSRCQSGIPIFFSSTLSGMQSPNPRRLKQNNEEDTGTEELTGLVSSDIEDLQFFGQVSMSSLPEFQSFQKRSPQHLKMKMAAQDSVSYNWCGCVGPLQESLPVAASISPISRSETEKTIN